MKTTSCTPTRFARTAPTVGQDNRGVQPSGQMRKLGCLRAADTPGLRRAAFAAVVVATFFAMRVPAITLGELDGNRHPNVCATIYYNPARFGGPFVLSSGTLISPRVVLTAGHHIHGLNTFIAAGLATLDDFFVSFNSDALDPNTWRGVSRIITHPNYDFAAQTEAGYGAIPLADVGVVILKEPAMDVTPARLAPLGFLDSLRAAGTLRQKNNQATFTVVGYGVGLGEPVGQIPSAPDGLRRVVQSEFLTLVERWLFLDQKFAQDNGGGANGDSGGPAFWIDPLTGEATLVAITSRGDARNLAAGIDYRVDTAEALDFIKHIIE